MECLKIIWKMTYRLGDDYEIHLPLGTLIIPPFRVRRLNEEPVQLYSTNLLVTTFCVPTEELDVDSIGTPAKGG